MSRYKLSSGADSGGSGGEFVTNEGENLGIKVRTLKVAPISPSPSNKFFYGRLEGDPDFFVLDLETYQRLTLPLLETN